MRALALSKLALSALGVLLFIGAAWAADPVGTYTCLGHSPDGGAAYKGVVTVVKTGETYQVTWLIGGKKTTGTGVGDEGFLAVSYQSGKDTGLALYGSVKADWKGVWTYQNGTSMGDESWTRQ